jgi:hypothetical protein
MVMIPIVLIIATAKLVKDGCDLARAFLMNEISAVTGSTELTDECGFTCGRTRDYLASRLVVDITPRHVRHVRKLSCQFSVSSLRLLSPRFLLAQCSVKESV